MDKVSTTLDRWLGRSSAASTFLAPIIPGTIGAIVTGYLSTWVTWISQFGAFGWWCAALAGGLATTAIYLGSGVARDKFAEARAKQKWSREVENVNPLDDNYLNQRIKLSDLAHPFLKRISGKTFSRCEILGSANIIMRGCNISGVGFANCDFVIGRDDAITQTTILLENCHIMGGSISNCTLFVDQQLMDVIREWAPNANVVTYDRPANG